MKCLFQWMGSDLGLFSVPFYSFSFCLSLRHTQRHTAQTLVQHLLVLNLTKCLYFSLQQFLCFLFFSWSLKQYSDHLETPNLHTTWFKLDDFIYSAANHSIGYQKELYIIRLRLCNTQQGPLSKRYSTVWAY